MKNLLLTLAISFCLFSCKKDDKSSLIGTWLSTDKGTQFTIKSLNGEGVSNFTLKGDELIWKLNSRTTNYKVIFVYPQTITLNEQGKDVIFIRIR